MALDVLIIHRMLDSTARSSDYLSNLVLFFMQLELNEELCKHGIDTYPKVMLDSRN